MRSSPSYNSHRRRSLMAVALTSIVGRRIPPSPPPSTIFRLSVTRAVQLPLTLMGTLHRVREKFLSTITVTIEHIDPRIPSVTSPICQMTRLCNNKYCVIVSDSFWSRLATRLFFNYICRFPCSSFVSLNGHPTANSKVLVISNCFPVFSRER